MKAKMENPNFWDEKEERQQKAVDKVKKKRKEYILSMILKNRSHQKN